MRPEIYYKPSGLVERLQSFDLDSVYKAATRMSKRLFDFVLALIGLILLAPVFAYVAVLIRRDSPGPVFFWGLRMGRGGKPFWMLKFRTMYERPESYEGPRVTADKDDRITPLGHWLRDTKINELPQLWNVLKGDMSLVGPRPEDVEIAATWPKDAFDEILSIRPGITSPTSVLYHDEEKLLSRDNLMRDYLKRILPDKIRLDRLYVRHHSFFSDLDAIFWTMAIVLPQLAKTKIPEGYLFAGPFTRFVHRYISWFLMDFVMALAITTLASLMWGLEDLHGIGPEYLPFSALMLAFLLSGFNAATGLNRVLWSEATLDDGMRLAVSTAFVTGMVFTVNYLQSLYGWFGFTPLPSSMIFFVGMLAAFGFIVIRYRLRVLSSLARRWVSWRQEASNVGERVLVVGLGEANKIANYLLRQHTFRTAFSVIGTVDNNNPSQHGMRVNGNWMLGAIKDIPSIVKRYDVGMVLSTIPRHNPENEHILEICQASGTRLLFLDDLLTMTDRQVTRPVGRIDGPLWAEGRLEFRAMHDHLTGLPNRYLFQDRLKQSLARAKRYKTQPAVVFIELDGVRKINQAHGDRISDQVIKDLSERLVRSMRESETLARLGFDRFALILDDFPADVDISRIGQRMIAAASQTYDIRGEKHLVIPKVDYCLNRGVCDALTAPEKPLHEKCNHCVKSSETAMSDEMN
ncbi:MAG: sugar transferase [Bacteroidota bacterium]